MLQWFANVKRPVVQRFRRLDKRAARCILVLVLIVDYVKQKDVSAMLCEPARSVHHMEVGDGARWRNVLSVTKVEAFVKLTVVVDVVQKKIARNRLSLETLLSVSNMVVENCVNRRAVSAAPLSKGFAVYMVM